MIRRFTSRETDPHERGVAFGEAWSAEVAGTVAAYEALYASVAGGPVDLLDWGTQARSAIRGWAPGLALEIEGIAAGAGLPPEHVYAINARTEILGALGSTLRGECSTVVALSTTPGVAPVAVQAWDWHATFADQWLVWTIHLADGRRIETLTEFGIVGKIAVSSSRLGVHFNLLRHSADRPTVGVPVHVIARRIIEESHDLDEALRLLASARPSASTALTFVAMDDQDATAVTAELTPDGPGYVLPDRDGLLLHTNHFLHPTRAAGDREPSIAGDSFFRYELLRRRLAQQPGRTTADVLRALDSHLGGGGALCCHPSVRETTGFGYATLATVSIDLIEGRLDVLASGPCTTAPAGHRLDQSEGVPTL